MKDMRTRASVGASACARLLLAALFLAAPISSVAQQSSQATRYFEDALTRYERNDTAGAVIQLKNALQQDPRMLAAYVLLGKAQLAQAEPAEAESALGRALELGAARSEVAVPLTQAFYDQGKYEAVLDRFPPDSLPEAQRVEVLVLRGHAHKALGDAGAAMRAFEEARALDPRFIPALLSQAELLAQQGKRDEAARLADQAVAAAPDNARLWNLKGALAAAAGDAPSALAAYEKALAISPNHAETRIARVSLLLDLRRTAEVEKDLAHLKQHSPSDPRANYLRAVFLAERGDHAGARAELQEAIRVLDAAQRDALRRRGPELLLLGGVAHYSLGAMERARSYLEDFLRSAPDHVGARRLLGSVRLAQGDARAAIDALDRALKLAPNDSETLALLAAAHMARKQFGTANMYLERALKSSGGAPAVHATFGLSLLGSGQSELGIEHLQRAFKKDPGLGRAGIPLAVLYLQRGQAKQAAEVAQAVVAREPKNAPLHNLLGVALTNAGDRAGGRAAYEKAIALDKELVAAQLNLGKLELLEGKTEQARARFERIVKERPKDTAAMSELAALEERAGRGEEAVRWLQKIHALDHRNAAAASQLVDFYIARRELDKALAVAKDADAATPENLVALAALGRAHLALGNRSAAHTIFVRMTRLASFDAVWLTRIAGYQLAANDPKGAAYSLEKALSAKPDHLPAQAMLVEMDLRAGDTAKAEQRAKTIVGRNPSSALGHRLLADVALAKKNYPDAIKGYRVALEKAANTEEALRLYGAYVQAGNLDQAIGFMESWVKGHPQDGLAIRALAEGHQRAGNLAAARSRYEQALKLRGGDPGVLNNLANVLARQGDARALETAQQAYALAPNNATIQDTLGWILVQRGDLDAGLRHLREARLRSPQDPEIRYHLASALARASRREEARRELEPAMAPGLSFTAQQDARKLWAELRKP
jgi:putative PEP-CTERM system TPR-repeat lipoprotein